MKRFTTYRFLSVLLIIGFCLPSLANTIATNTDADKTIDSTPPPQHNKLIKTDISGFDRAFRTSHSDTDYSSITLFVKPVEIHFSDYWRKQHRMELTETEEQKLKDRYAVIAQKALIKKLQKKRNIVISQTQENATHILEAKIDKLFLYAPDFSRRHADQYARDLGHANIHFRLTNADTKLVELELSDAQDMHTIAEKLQKVNRTVNARAFKSVMNRWAKRLGQAMQPEKSAG